MPLTDIRYSSGDRTKALWILDALNDGARVIDVGGATSFAHDYVTAVVDFGPPVYPVKHFWQGDLCHPATWEPVEEFVHEYGRFDYCICTHTLEDTANAPYVAEMLGQVAERGFIAVPSKFIELNRWGELRGFIHHRWIFNIEKGRLMAYPKIGFCEARRFDDISPRSSLGEIQVYWEGRPPIDVINGGYLGPTVEAVMEFYDRGLHGGD